MPSGRNATVQVGAQSNFSTAVAPTIILPIVSEGLDELTNTISPDTLTGRRTIDRKDVSGKKIEGPMELVVYPDSIGILLAAALGAEDDPAAVDGSAVYDHTFTPMSQVTGSSLPKLTIVTDRITAVKGYIGAKINSMSFSARVNDYLRASLSFRGHSEASDTKEALTPSTLRPLQFVDGLVTVDGSTYDEITNLTLTIDNDLDDNLFVLNGEDRMIEIEPNNRMFRCEFEVLYSADVESTRENKYKNATSIAVIATFTSSEAVLTGKYYTLTFSMPNVSIVTMPPGNASGPQRLRTRVSAEALETGGVSPITVTLRDGQATKHLIPA